MEGWGVQHSERSGQLFALLGFAVLSVGDGVIKTIAGDWSPAAAGALRFAIGAVLLSALLRRVEGAQAFIPLNPWLQIGRGACLGLTTTFFFWAIFMMPLADTMALTFVAPVLTALLSGPLLGEKVRRQVFIASLFALIGVVIVLRPNFAEWGFLSLLPLLSALFFSLMVILNRASAGQGSALSMQMFIAVVAAPIMLITATLGHHSGIEVLRVGVPDWTVVARCALVAVLASGAHTLVYVGTQRAGASSVAPMSYIQVVVATIIGWSVFGDIPDAMTFLGVAVIIGAGLYLWQSSERQPA